MKSSVTILILLLGKIVVAQTQLKDDTLICNNGYRIVEKEKLSIGTGTMPDGSFKFIRVSATSLFKSIGGNQARVNEVDALDRSWSGKQLKVVRIDKRGSKKHGFAYYPIVNVGATRFEVDIENAITSGEIKVPDEFLPKKDPVSVVVKQEVSIADEITKLKKLYDDGVLTKEEFEAQKKKLLEKQ